MVKLWFHPDAFPADTRESSVILVEETSEYKKLPVLVLVENLTCKTFVPNNDK